MSKQIVRILGLGIMLLVGSALPAVAQTPAFPPAANIAGDWDGIFQCDGYTNQFSIELQSSDQRRLSGSMQRSILGPTFRKHQQPYEKSLQVIGQYDSRTGTIALGTGQGRAQEIQMQGIVSPTGERMTGTVKWSLGRGCSSVVMGKRFSREVSSILERAKPTLYRPKVDPRANCDNRIVEWISQPLGYDQYSYQLRGAAGYASLALFEDSRFEPFFGKPYSKMSKRDLTKLENQIARPCWGALQAIGGDAKTATGVLSVVRQLPGSNVNVALYPYARAIARAWQDHSIASADPANSQQVGQFTNAARLFTQVLWPEGDFSFSEQLANKKSNTGTQRMNAALKELLSEPSPTFDALERIAAFELRIVVGSASAMESPNRVTRRSRSEQAAASQALQAARAEARAEYVVTAEAASAAGASIRSYLNRHAADAATAYASEQVTVQQARDNLASIGRRSDSRLRAYLEPGVMRQVDAIFSSQRNQLANQFAVTEKSMYALLRATTPKDLAGLKSLNAFDQVLRKKYGELFMLNAFSALRAAAATDRQRILSSQQQILIGQIRQSDTVSAMQDIVDTTVLAVDRQSGAFEPIQRALTARRQELAPFTGYPGADFLNAVYAGDVRTIDAIDTEYRNQFKRSLSELGGAGVFDNFYRYAIDQIRLIDPVMAVYLLNYQKNYKRCLRIDAAAFTVTRTVPTTVTTNLLGVEIARSEGYTINDDFLVNKDFESAFRRVGKMQPTNFLAKLVDQYMSNGGITAVTDGTRRMMREQACDGEVVERMEERMRAALFR
ncbi:secreted protein [Congregibacter litoralis]|uniref:Uncharacterized protein n=1 Tax=Congregibacter litoralis KT71 TaxID=314285 RepID=A4A4J9_9GAMM|nr:secreted protein [Congregibacter litoralis]EAQ98720.1 hypothetical protein KT71_08842 [Congregibacter litoralis KT71]